MAHSSAPVRIFRYGNQISLFSISTGLSKHKQTHIHKLLHPRLYNTNKKPVLIKATSLNTGSILFSPSQRSTLIQTPFFLFVSDLPRCVRGFVWGLLWPEWASVQIASASYRKRRRRRRRRKQRERERERWWEVKGIWSLSMIWKPLKNKVTNTLIEAMKCESLPLNVYMWLSGK